MDNFSLPKIQSISSRKLAYKILANYPSSVGKIFKKFKEFEEELSTKIYKAKSHLQRLQTLPKGLKNFGNTCYLNSSLQLLYSIPPIKYLILSSFTDGLVTRSLNFIFNKLSYSFLSSTHSKKLINSYLDYDDNPINPLEQKDAGEFLITLFNKLEEEGLKEITSEISGKLSIFIKCNICKIENKSSEDFVILSLEIKDCKSIYESIELMNKHEILANNNQYHCSRCNCKVDAEKYSKFEIIPNYLIISFKRFKYDINLQKMIKIYDVCEFNAKLLLDINEAKEEFELQGIILHIGTEDAGHYVSIFNRDGIWYSFDDEIVKKIEDTQLNLQNLGKYIGYDKIGPVKITPYIALYKKKSTFTDQDFQKTDSFSMQPEIQQKNKYIFQLKTFLSDGFPVFLSKLIEKPENLDYALEFYFSAFIYSIENHTFIFKKIFKKFLNQLELQESKEKCLNYCITNYQQIIKILSSNIDLHIKEISCQIIRKSIDKSTLQLSSQFAAKLFEILPYNHLHFNFTYIIELLVKFLEIADNGQDFYSNIIEYIINTTKEAPSALGLDNRHMQSEQTNFNSFFCHLTSDTIIYNLINNFSSSNFLTIVNNARYENQIQYFAEIIKIYSATSENLMYYIDLCQNYLMPYQKMMFLVNYFERLDDLDSLCKGDNQLLILSIFQTSNDFTNIEKLLNILSRKIKDTNKRGELFASIRESFKYLRNEPNLEILKNNYDICITICDNIIRGTISYKEEDQECAIGRMYLPRSSNDAGIVLDIEGNIVLLSTEYSEKIIIKNR